MNRVLIWWQHRNLPTKIGLAFAFAGILLAAVGIARGNVPLNPLSIFLALGISGGGWFLVSWAIATAAVDVETDEISENSQHSNS